MTATVPAPVSPLLESNPDSLSELFNRSPSQWSDSDFDRLIEAQREARARWQQAELAAKTPKARKPAANAGITIDLDEIGL